MNVRPVRHKPGTRSSVIRWRPCLYYMVATLMAGCVAPRSTFRAPRRAPDTLLRMTTTGYCSCGACCGWTRNWYGRPVVAYGPRAGEPKRVGMTASGTRARPGTVAADTDVLAMGTRVFVPGYGYGRVEDRGGAIKGNHIDLYFSRHRDALRWGRRQVDVYIWYPR